MKKTRVMVVDDQFVARQLFELYLKSSERYELVHMVESAAFAETFMKSDAVDLVLMDMPYLYITYIQPLNLDQFHVQQLLL